MTTYPDEASFVDARGEAPSSHENFDEFEAGTDEINDQIPGVDFSSPNDDSDGYYPIQVRDDTGASSRPNIRFGGFVLDRGGDSLQIVVLAFSPPIRPSPST